jgi:asparagine synthase (glutamine-hydrolysing)
VAWDDRFRVDRETLARMSERIAHRGPDGEGLYLNHEQQVAAERPQVGLVHRRLAILDPDPRADQPFTDGRGRWIVFNGEIYNFRELRAELASLRPDYAWRTEGDTEVLLLAWDAWGERCVERLNGMFAFAVWDEGRQRLFLARDPTGQKPLYLAYGGAALVAAALEPGSPAARAGIPFVAFASELAALRELPWLRQLPADPSSVADYLRWGYIASPATIYRGLQKVSPGWSHCFGHEYWAPTRYVDVNARPDVAPQEPACPVRQAVERAVSRQLVSDVPLGCFLSGGIDSSIMAACMRKATGSGGRVLTFSIGFDDPRYDETSFAAAVAGYLGTEHRQFTVRPNAAADLPRLAAVFGEPFADSSALPTHYLARETRQHVKVALSGDGGDELFGGYDRYRALDVAGYFHALPGPLRAMITARLWQGLPGVHPKSRLTRLKRLLATLAQPAAERYAGYMRLFDDPMLGRLMAEPPPKPSTGDVEEIYLQLHEGRGDVEAALATDRVTYLPGDLHTKVDRAAMLHALEVRAPFMDPDVLRLAAGLTGDQLLKGGPKRMLREAFAADLPAWVFKRRKMGFAVPIGEWFRDKQNAVRAMLHDSLTAADSFAGSHFRMETVRKLLDEHDAGRADHAQRLYALLMLELWKQSLEFGV